MKHGPGGEEAPDEDVDVVLYGIGPKASLARSQARMSDQNRARTYMIALTDCLDGHQLVSLPPEEQDIVVDCQCRAQCLKDLRTDQSTSQYQDDL